MINLSLFYILIQVSFSQDYSIVDHSILGCPTNSICNKELGEKNLKWNIVLQSKKNKILTKMKTFNRSFGLPVKVWATKESPLAIQWDSRCQNHRIPNPKILESVIFVKHLDELNKNRDFYTPKVLVLRNKKIIVYPTMANETPLFIKNNKLAFNREQSGNYFSMLVSKQGKITTSTPIRTNNLPQEVACSKELVSAFKTVNRPEKLYKSHYCKALWNSKRKKYETVIFGWSCN